MAEAPDRDSAEDGTPDILQIQASKKFPLSPKRAEEIIRAVDMAVWFLELNDAEEALEPDDDGGKETMVQRWNEFCAEFRLPASVREEGVLPVSPVQFHHADSAFAIREMMTEAYAVRRRTAEVAVIETQEAVRSFPRLGRYLSNLERDVSDLSALAEDHDEKHQIIFKRFDAICEVLGIVPSLR
jgi:hypothetical protein